MIDLVNGIKVQLYKYNKGFGLALVGAEISICSLYLLVVCKVSLSFIHCNNGIILALQKQILGIGIGRQMRLYLSPVAKKPQIINL